MNKIVSNLLVFAVGIMLGGCATPNFKPVTDDPPDKALVYIYRGNGVVGSGVGHKIYANQRPVSLLNVGNYYPYLATPGEITFTSKQVSLGAEHLFDFMVPKFNLGEVKVDAGKTYYLKFTWTYVGVTFWPKLVQMDNKIGEREITNCILAECLETNLVTK
jgi:hypothetical protein